MRFRARLKNGFIIRKIFSFPHRRLKHTSPKDQDKSCNEFGQNWLQPFLKKMQKFQSWMSSADMRWDLDFMAIWFINFIHSVFDIQQLDHILIIDERTSDFIIKPYRWNLDRFAHPRSCSEFNSGKAKNIIVVNFTTVRKLGLDFSSISRRTIADEVLLFCLNFKSSSFDMPLKVDHNLKEAPH